MQSNASEINRKPLLIWLGIMLVMVLLMVVVGGVTRLTESGLSMVNWHPIHGIFPPLGEIEWQAEFKHYQASPEYQRINFGMTLSEFKGIFLLEYIHRLLGRFTGLFFFIPFAFFLIKGMVSRPLALKLSGIFLLGGAQGLLGWYMVKSGLVNEPSVSPLRLAAHLSMACLLFSLLFWQWLKLLRPTPIIHFSKFPLGLILLIFAQIILGALIAGLDAGLAYDTFPTMNDQWLPNGVWLLEPWWHNLYQNPTTVQFIHRLGAVIITLYLVAMISKLRQEKLCVFAQRCCHGLIIILIFQITLGALTVIHHVPILLASLHQFVALLLLGCAVALLYTRNTAIRLA